MRGVGALRILGALTVGGLAIAGGPLFSAIGAPMSAAAGAANFRMSLSGQPVGAPRTVSGGETDVVTATNLADYAIKKKTIGNVVFKPIVIQAGAEMSKGFYSKLAGSLDGTAAPFDGAVTSYDASMAALYEIDFNQALVQEIDFPAADASSIEATFLSVKLMPETVVRKTATGSAQALGTPSAQKRLLARNFRLTIDGVSCQRVTKVSSISTTSPSFTIEFLAADRPSFDAWLKAGTAIQRTVQVDAPKGSSGAKDGELVYLTPDLHFAILDLKLTGLHVTSVSPVSSDPKATATIAYQHVSIAGGAVLN